MIERVVHKNLVFIDWPYLTKIETVLEDIAREERVMGSRLISHSHSAHGMSAIFRCSEPYSIASTTVWREVAHKEKK